MDEDVKKCCDWYYVWINYILVLVVDVIYFNFVYYWESFIGVLLEFLWVFFDYQGLENVVFISCRVYVLLLGMNLQVYDEVEFKYILDELVLFWNYCWEYDKNLEEFFDCCESLQVEGYFFKLIVVGEFYVLWLKVFVIVKNKFFECLFYWGFVKDFNVYVGLLKLVIILFVISWQDFFGGSVVEVFYCGFYLLLFR